MLHSLIITPIINRARRKILFRECIIFAHDNSSSLLTRHAEVMYILLVVSRVGAENFADFMHVLFIVSLTDAKYLSEFIYTLLI